MQLGYLMNQQPSMPARETRRLKLAYELGFSEFYSVMPADQNSRYTGPEQADLLQRSTDLPEMQVPQIVAINGEVQAPKQITSQASSARPSVTPEQIATNARNQELSLSVSWLNQTDLARHWAAHVAGSTHSGQRARPENWSVARTVLICDNPAHARAAVRAKDGPCYSYYSKLAKPGSDVDAMMDDWVLYGTIEMVLSQLDALVTAAGPFGGLTVVDHGWADQEMAENSLSALASAFAPAVRRSCALS